MTEKKKKKKKKKNNFIIPKASRDFADSYYKYKTPKDVNGEPVESLKLSEEDAAWLEQFEKEYYGNTARYGEIHSKDERTISELDSANNARNRDIFAKNYYVPIRNNDIARYIYHGYDCYIGESLKLKGVEYTIKDIIQSAAIEIETIDSASAYGTRLELIEAELRKASVNIVKAINLEKKYRRKHKKR